MDMKWYKLPPLNHTMEETSKLITLLQEKYNPQEMKLKMNKINDIGRYLIEVYFLMEKRK